MQAKTDYQEETTQYLFDAAGTLIAERNPAYLQVSYHHDRAGRLLDRIQGFPDFSQHAIKEVKVGNLTGKIDADALLANKVAGYKTTSEGFTWHHVQDGQTMQLVPYDVHKQTTHTGGSAWLKSGGAAVSAGIAGNAEASNGGLFGITWSDVKGFAGSVKDFAVDVLTDPRTYYAPLMLLTPSSTGGCSNGVCSDMVDWSKMGPTSSYNPAGGGFLLYPNKASTNMMRSVYSK